MPRPAEQPTSAARRSAPPARLSDNTAGRPLNSQAVAQEIVLILGPQLLAELVKRREPPSC